MFEDPDERGVYIVGKSTDDIIKDFCNTTHSYDSSKSIVQTDVTQIGEGNGRSISVFRRVLRAVVLEYDSSSKRKSSGSIRHVSYDGILVWGLENLRQNDVDEHVKIKRKPL